MINIILSFSSVHKKERGNGHKKKFLKSLQGLDSCGHAYLGSINLL